MTLKEAQLWGKKKFEATYFSVGYLLESNKQYVVIAATYDDDVDEPGYNDVSMVMKSVIKKIERL